MSDSATTANIKRRPVSSGERSRTRRSNHMSGALRFALLISSLALPGLGWAAQPARNPTADKVAVFYDGPSNGYAKGYLHALFLQNLLGHFNLGADLVAMNRPREAVFHLRKTLELRPDMVGAHGFLGSAYYALGDYAAAWKEVHLCQERDEPYDPRLVELLEERMPEPEE